MNKKVIFTIVISILFIFNFSSVADLDQFQDLNQSAYRIFGEQIASQSFIPSKSIITKIVLNLAKTGDEYLEINVALCDEKTLDSKKFLAIDSISTEEVYYQSTWVDIDIEDTHLIPGETYYIIVFSEEGTEDDFFEWFFGIENYYKNGLGSVSENNGNTWADKPEIDFCFKTYGYNPPSIEKKVLIPGTDENNNYNWVDEVTVHGWEEELKFKIRIENTDPSEFIHPTVVDEMPNFLIYNKDSSIAPVTYSDNYVEWDIGAMEPNSYWEVKYSTFVENKQRTGINNAKVYLKDPPIDENIKDNRNFLKNIFEKVQKRITKNTLLNFVFNKFCDLLNIEKRFVDNSNLNKNSDRSNNLLSVTDASSASDQVQINVYKNNPKVDFNGQILIEEIHIGDVVDEEDDIYFFVGNIGESNSKLDWELSVPEWISSYNIEVVDFSYKGKDDDLCSGEYTKVNIKFYLKEAEKENEEYSGFVTVRNSYDYTDYVEVPIIIKCVRSKENFTD